MRAPLRLLTLALLLSVSLKSIGASHGTFAQSIPAYSHQDMHIALEALGYEEWHTRGCIDLEQVETAFQTERLNYNPEARYLKNNPQLRALVNLMYNDLCIAYDLVQNVNQYPQAAQMRKDLSEPLLFATSPLKHKKTVDAYISLHQRYSEAHTEPSAQWRERKLQKCIIAIRSFKEQLKRKNVPDIDYLIDSRSLRERAERKLSQTKHALQTMTTRKKTRSAYEKGHQKRQNTTRIPSSIQRWHTKVCTTRIHSGNILSEIKKTEKQFALLENSMLRKIHKTKLRIKRNRCRHNNEIDDMLSEFTRELTIILAYAYKMLGLMNDAALQLKNGVALELVNKMRATIEKLEKQKEELQELTYEIEFEVIMPPDQECRANR